MDPKKIIADIQLPTLSKTLFEIIEVERRNSISFLDDIKKIVEKDPLLSAHILKIANSPFYGFRQKVRTISHAVGLLGVRQIKNLAFSFSVFDFLKKMDYKPAYGGVFNLILKKTLLISSSSTILAQKTGYLNSEELYIAGLLAEIGQFFFFLHAPEKYCRIYSVLDKKLIENERETFQIDHIQLGTAFCDRFNMPASFRTAVENHSRLQSSEEIGKIAFVSNQIAELLLCEDEEEKTVIFRELENHTKKLLHLSLSEIDAAIKRLPGIMESFMADFPEVQKDLKKIVDTGSSLIINLMKKEMEMITMTRELTDSRNKLEREKIFLSHMLNLSYFFSSLMPPLKTVSLLFDYFENFIHEFTIEFIYRQPGSDDYTQITNKERIEGSPIDIGKYPNLERARIANEAVRLDSEEMERLGKAATLASLVFPISYHHNFFGFLVLSVEKKSYFTYDLEMTYVQILSNIIANAFQNYASFEGMKNETNKKQLVTRELLKSDEKLNHSRKTLVELQKAEILGEMLPIIFHKLKNKLTPVLGYSQILLAKVQDPVINQRIKKIEKNASELTTQLNLLRDYFKGDTISKERENLNEIIAGLRPDFDKIEAPGEIKIVTDTDYNLPDDLLNRGQIESLIVKMVENAAMAIKENGTGGQIDIKTEAGKDYYKLIIRDNGIGIKEENLYRIWTPFYTTYPNRPGIGLTVCEKILANHNVSTDVRSLEGQHTEFEMTFSMEPLQEKKPLLEVDEAKKDRISGKILIVDDEVYLLDLMKEILMSEGDFEIVTTTRGKEAIERINQDFDLVISDIRMPEVDGMTVYKHLEAKGMESRMIMVTADPLADDIVQFLEKNRVECLQKPFELMKFKQMVIDKLSQSKE